MLDEPARLDAVVFQDRVVLRQSPVQPVRSVSGADFKRAYCIDHLEAPVGLRIFGLVEHGQSRRVIQREIDQVVFACAVEFLQPEDRFLPLHAVLTGGVTNAPLPGLVGAEIPQAQFVAHLKHGAVKCSGVGIRLSRVALISIFGCIL